MANLTLFVILLGIIAAAQCEFHAHKKCSCVCPGLKNISTEVKSRSIYQANIPASNCSCMEFVVPHVRSQINGSISEYCHMCECKFHMNNASLMLMVLMCLCCSMCACIMYIACLRNIIFILQQALDLESYIEEEGYWLENGFVALSEEE